MELFIELLLHLGKSYIGQTINLDERKIKHKNASLNESIINRAYEYTFHRAIRKYGFENIKWEILEKNIPQELLNIKECEYIQGFNSYKNGYNSTLGGDGVGSRRKSSSFWKKIYRRS